LTRLLTCQNLREWLAIPQKTTSKRRGRPCGSGKAKNVVLPHNEQAGVPTTTGTSGTPGVCLNYKMFQMIFHIQKIRPISTSCMRRIVFWSKKLERGTTWVFGSMGRKECNRHLEERGRSFRWLTSSLVQYAHTQGYFEKEFEHLTYRRTRNMRI